jgi:integrase
MTIRLRTNKLKDGRLSFYLLYYDPANRARHKEYLGLYNFSKPKTSLEKEHNRETKTLAESVQAKKLLALQESKFGFDSKRKQEVPLLTYFEALVEKRKSSNINYSTWRSTLVILKKFASNDLKNNPNVSNINSAYILKFKEYLLGEKLKSTKTRLSQNSASSYFNIFKTAIKEAYNSKLIKNNPLVGIKSIRPAETRREFLTEEEIQRLFKTECQIPVIKQAFLFGVLTGLRFSDINNLHWQDLQFSETHGWFIRFTQRKTKKTETLHITNQTRELLGEQTAAEDKVFKGLKYSAHNNHLLDRWVMNAGISKHITFHSSRHTHACLLLSKGVDIYTVSKILGHRELKTTQIYAKVLDTQKIDAIKKIPVFEI